MELTASIVEGLDYVGTGKKGSETCPRELIEKILEEARVSPPAAPTLGAFFGGLWMKGVAADEQALAALLGPDALHSEVSLLSYFDQGVSAKVVETASTLLRGKLLGRSEAREVGEFLFGDGPGDGLRTLMATVMRVRYASPEEYAGLLDVLAIQYPDSFKAPVPVGPKIVQLAEPFDGVERSSIVTPILMREISSLGYRVVAVCGRNPGPKRGHNLLSVAEKLSTAQFLTGNEQLGVDEPHGWFLRQVDVAPALDRWVELRRQMVKRPGLATLEKYVSPFHADVFVGSAFHHNFNDKMIEIGECVGFQKVIVTFKTVEGSLAPSLGRPTKVTISQQGQLSEVTLSPQEFGLDAASDPKLPVSLEQNVQWIESYLHTGTSGDAYFDNRVKLAVGMYRRLLED